MVAKMKTRATTRRRRKKLKRMPRKRRLCRSLKIGHGWLLWWCQRIQSELAEAWLFGIRAETKTTTES